MMKKEQTGIAALLNEWKSIKAKENNNSFFKNNNLNGLIINQTMSINDLIETLHVIENLKFKINLVSSMTFKKWLVKNSYRTLHDFDIKLPNTSSLFNLSEHDKKLYTFFINLHQTLLSHYELASAHAHGQIPVKQIIYTQSQLQNSTDFQDLEKSSRQERLSDCSTVVSDIKRKGVTFYGAVIVPGDYENEKDPIILQMIENFAGDKIDKPHSRANKIYNFGGQFLEATLLQEFSNVIKFNEQPELQLERGAVKGHINWSKDPDTQMIYATVNLRLFTCAFINPAIQNETQKFLAIGSDGASLIELDDEELIKVISRCRDEIKGITEYNVTPICELSAKIKLIPTISSSEHYLKADQLTIKLYTSELFLANAPQSAPISHQYN